MKRIAPLFLLVLGSLDGCSTDTNLKLIEERGGAVVQGRGGVVSQMDGVDFWESGGPRQKYQILGAIYDDPGWIGVSTGELRKNEARLVKQSGGDAAIVSEERERAGKYRNGTIYYRLLTKLIVIQYVK